MDDAVRVLGTGSTVTTAGTSARITLPTTQGGYAPRYIRIVSDGFANVKVGDSTTVATTNDVLITPYFSTILNVFGATHIAHIQNAAGSKVNIIPLEDC